MIIGDDGVYLLWLQGDKEIKGPEARKDLNRAFERET
jgi:hypothetical protein